MTEIIETPAENPDGTYNKRQVNAFIKSALEKAGEINTSYTQLFEGTAEKVAILPTIDAKAQEILTEYEKIQTLNSENSTKLSDLQTKLDEIRNYHKELIENDDSIKTDIQDSQDKITEFYVYLFGGSEGSTGEEAKVKTAIESILKFHDDLTKEDGLAKAVEAAHATIIKTYADLYDTDEKGVSKITTLNSDIENIKSFRNTVDKELIPLLEDTKKDITSTRKDVKALLSDTAGATLIHRFLESKREYQQEPKYVGLQLPWYDLVAAILINCIKFIAAKSTVLLNYALFILPLLLSVLVLMRPEFISMLLGSPSENFSVSKLLSELNFFGRTTLSIPLWWISWFGQRSIFQNRRLAEEYNHKAQVATMYLNFSSRDMQGVYPLSKEARKKLDDTLIEAIARHPGRVYGRDATILDKLVRIFEVKTGIQNSVVSGVAKAIIKAEK